MRLRRRLQARSLPPRTDAVLSSTNRPPHPNPLPPPMTRSQGTLRSPAGGEGTILGRLMGADYAGRLMTGVRIWGLVVHPGRVAVLVAIVLLIRAKHRDYLLAQRSDADHAPPLVKVQAIFPAATELRDSPDAAAVWDVLDADGKRLGSVLQSSPDSDKIIGFSGPSNLLVGVDPAGRIAGLAVLSSRDTPEHVAQVIADPKFLRSLDGLTLSQAANRRKADAVSGATLTSLAMVEGIQRRLGGKPASLKFPGPIALADVQAIFPKAEKLVTDPGDPATALVRGPGDEPLGWVLRTSPAADNVIGYQGPSDVLLGFDPHGKVVALAVAKSYDNEPYVRYVKDDDGFRTLFAGKSLEEMAGLDVKADVEGVTGATMTSQAIAPGARRRRCEEADDGPRTAAGCGIVDVADRSRRRRQRGRDSGRGGDGVHAIPRHRLAADPVSARRLRLPRARERRASVAGSVRRLGPGRRAARSVGTDPADDGRLRAADRDAAQRLLHAPVPARGPAATHAPLCPAARRRRAAAAPCSRRDSGDLAGRRPRRRDDACAPESGESRAVRRVRAPHRRRRNAGDRDRGCDRVVLRADGVLPVRVSDGKSAGVSAASRPERSADASRRDRRSVRYDRGS